MHRARRTRLRLSFPPQGAQCWLVYHQILGWYTEVMPTVRPRHQITETPAVAHAIDLAAQRWPGEPRSKLLRRLVDVGGGALEQNEHQVDDVRREAVMASSGKYADVFEPGYMGELRQDWPE